MPNFKCRIKDRMQSNSIFTITIIFTLSNLKVFQKLYNMLMKYFTLPQYKKLYRLFITKSICVGYRLQCRFSPNH